MKEFADDNLKFDENSRKFSKWVGNTVEKEKLHVTNNFSYSYSVFRRLILQTCEDQVLFGKGLKNITRNYEKYILLHVLHVD